MVRVEVKEWHNRPWCIHTYIPWNKYHLHISLQSPRFLTNELLIKWPQPLWPNNVCPTLTHRNTISVEISLGYYKWYLSEILENSIYLRIGVVTKKDHSWNIPYFCSQSDTSVDTIQWLFSYCGVVCPLNYLFILFLYLFVKCLPFYNKYQYSLLRFEIIISLISFSYYTLWWWNLGSITVFNFIVYHSL